MKNRPDNIPVCTVDHFGKQTSAGFFVGKLKDNLFSDKLSQLHRATYYMLIYCKSGNGSFVSDDQSYMLESPMVICIRPDTVFRLQAQTEQTEGFIFCMTKEYINLELNPQLLSRFSFLRNDIPPHIRLTKDQNNFWIGLMEMMHLEFARQSDNSNNLIISYANILLSEFDRCIRTGLHIQSKSLASKKTEMFTDLVNQHYKEHKLPSAYATMLHISNNYLNKICKRDTGFTAGELIRKRILAEAKRMLCHTSQNVNEIAIELGFDSTSYFITFFKKTTGVSPDAFRKNPEGINVKK